MCSPRCCDYWSRLLALADAQSDDPGLSRRGFLAASAVPFLAVASAAAAPNSQTSDLLDATLSFDLHSHPGLFKSMSNDTLAGHRQSAERSEEHTSELQSRVDLVCRLLLEKKNKK